MTLLQMAVIFFLFHRALRVQREPVRSRARSRCSSR